jgi:predicted glutamine amidotransferase
MWMHNGGLGGWKHIKRHLANRLADRWYLGVKGSTDSEWAFALFLDTLERLGHDPSACPENGFGPTVLRKAVEQTIAIINEMTDAIPENIIQSEDVDTRSLLNFAVTDGHSIICTRYISSAKDEAASLYYSSGTQWATRTASPDDRQYQMERKDKGADIVLVASEPLTFERGKPNCSTHDEYRLMRSRKLGERANEFNLDHPSPDGHDAPYSRQVLRAGSVPRPFQRLRPGQRTGIQRESSHQRVSESGHRRRQRTRQLQEVLGQYHGESESKSRPRAPSRGASSALPTRADLCPQGQHGTGEHQGNESSRSTHPQEQHLALRRADF